jgi:glycosyltransferase involved in cell wall biosynthesis
MSSHTSCSIFSVVVPLYRSEPNLPRLFGELVRIAGLSPLPVEIVFVDDGSPDACGKIVEAKLPSLPFSAQLVRLTRNFGAFAAIAAGLKHATGEYFAVIAADLQEPPEILLRFLEKMRSGEADVVFGVRAQRADPFFSRLSSNLFWALYRRLVNPQIPAGGVDVFGCNRKVRDQICAMKEVETSLVGLLFWIGYRRGFVPYDRRERLEGKSAWTLSMKAQYLVNSVFNFTDLPIRLLLTVGVAGMLLAFGGAITVLWARLSGRISVPGYSAIVLAIFFFGGLTAVGLGIVGQYVWLCLQNARGRPSYIVDGHHVHQPD